jgi:hypothetical protein
MFERAFIGVARGAHNAKEGPRLQEADDDPSVRVVAAKGANIPKQGTTIKGKVLQFRSRPDQTCGRGATG